MDLTRFDKIGIQISCRIECKLAHKRWRARWQYLVKQTYRYLMTQQFHFQVNAHIKKNVCYDV